MRLKNIKLGLHQPGPEIAVDELGVFANTAVNKALKAWMKAFESGYVCP